MKRYTIGLITGALLAISAMMFIGAQNKNLGDITVNSIKILWTNKLLIKINSFIPIYWWYFDNPLLREKNYIKSIQIAKKVSIYFNKHYKQFNNYIKMGIKPIWLDQGTFSKKEFINSQNFDYDIVFFGSLNIWILPLFFFTQFINDLFGSYFLGEAMFNLNENLTEASIKLLRTLLLSPIQQIFKL